MTQSHLEVTHVSIPLVKDRHFSLQTHHTQNSSAVLKVLKLAGESKEQEPDPTEQAERIQRMLIHLKNKNWAHICNVG